MCTPYLIQRPRLRQAQQLQSRIERAGLKMRLCRGERALGALCRVARQLDGALQKRRRGGHAAAGPRSPGRPLEFGGDLLIGPRRRRRQMPRPSIGVKLAIGHLGQRPVRRLAFL